MWNGCGWQRKWNKSLVTIPLDSKGFSTSLLEFLKIFSNIFLLGISLALQTFCHSCQESWNQSWAIQIFRNFYEFSRSRYWTGSHPEGRPDLANLPHINGGNHRKSHRNGTIFRVLTESPLPFPKFYIFGIFAVAFLKINYWSSKVYVRPADGLRQQQKSVKDRTDQ